MKKLFLTSARMRIALTKYTNSVNKYAHANALMLICLLTSYMMFAQSPQSFKYQAVARDASGNELTNASITARATIHDLFATGTILYQETFAVTTNQFGLFSINIGQGIVVQGNFAAIPWATGAKYLQQEVDFGTGYQNMGTSQLLSVPYALYSANGTPGPTGAAGPAGPAGANGVTGAPGANGATGVAGNNATIGKEKFTASGTFTVPAGITTVWVSMCGGGGGGGGGSNSGGGGGGADAIIAVPVNVTPTQTITVTVGSGGTPNTGGGTSSFGTLNTSGGGAGSGVSGGGAGGVGGSKGSAGGQGTNPFSGAGGGCIFGSGGGGTSGGSGSGGDGGGYGGGGGGGAGGGTGSSGFVLVEW